MPFLLSSQQDQSTEECNLSICKLCQVVDNNNNTNICKAHIVSIRAESEVPFTQIFG